MEKFATHAISHAFLKETHELQTYNLLQIKLKHKENGAGTNTEKSRQC